MTNALDDTVSILINDGLGQGTFLPAVAYHAGLRPNGLAVDDFNLDGKADLVVGISDGTNVSVLLGNGNGTFQPAVTYG